MFDFVLAFHDASHGRLHPVPWLNELLGHLLGSLALVPLSVYRYAHARHHSYLGTKRDPELWPFNSPEISRAARVSAGILEIVLGAVYSPLLFLRAVVIGKLSPAERREILLGYLTLGLVWGLNLSLIHLLGMWDLFLAVVFIPMLLSGMLQTLNKFVQHLGLHGKTVLGLTRTVLDTHWSSKMISKYMLYNDYHGTHHRYAKIPYYHLPPATPYTLLMSNEPCPVFSNIFSALWNMLPCLANPKTGPQWLGVNSTPKGSSWQEANRI
jgi:fatty acid desaturase